MERPLASLLYLTLALGWCVATASAYSVYVDGPSSASPGNVIEFDVILDSEGQTLYGYVMRVYFNPAVLSPDEYTSERHPLVPGPITYIYPNPSFELHASYWYIEDFTPVVPIMTDDVSIATLVFHVMDVPWSYFTNIYPSVELLVDGSGFDVSHSARELGTYVHIVPEPMSPLLLASGAGLLILLGRLRRRNRAA